MGNRLNRMMDKQLISERSLIAVQQLVEFLKQNVHRRDIFRAIGQDNRIQQIANELEKGGSNLRNLLDQGWAVESAAALQLFLLRLRKPLIPLHIQALALDENAGVPAEIVAEDILGLLRQDVGGRHVGLITAVLELLHYILKHSPADELTGSNIPITMLPIFFNMQDQHILHWRRVAMIFIELIRSSPLYLNLHVDEFQEDLELIENFNINNQEEEMNQVNLQQRLLQVNVILRRYTFTPHHRGDNLNHSIEVVRFNRRRRRSRSRARLLLVNAAN